MTTSATTTRKAKGQRRGRPLGGGRRAKVQGDNPVLRAVEKMVEADRGFDSPPGDGRKLLNEIRDLVRSGERIAPYRLAVAAEKFRFNANKVLGLAWQRKDGEITKAEFLAELGRALSSFRQIVDQKERDDLKRRGLDGELLSVATDDELLQFHVWREAEADRKRVCPALPKAELRSVLAALCKRDWTRTDQWVRVESLRRWLAMSPEAIRQAAGSGRWATDIAVKSPESRRLGGPMVALIEVMRVVQDGGRQLPRELAEAGAAAGFDAAALMRLSWRRKDKEIAAGGFKESLGLLLDIDEDTKQRAIRFCCWAIRTHLKLSSPQQGRRGGKPSYLLGPRAVARVLRAYAAAGGESGPEATTTAATLDRIGQARPSRKRWTLPKNPPVEASVTKCPK